MAALVLLVGLPLMAMAIPTTVRIPRDKDARPFAPAARARFSHPAHGLLRCFQCHPNLFPQDQVAFTHADMDQGRFCAACHEGSRAPAVNSYPCEACHAPGR
jgi:c(7)-type cytochrome triheme protein